jgi:MFS family permease
MPQAMAAMSLKLTMPRLLRAFGYRRVLIANTLGIGAMILLFCTLQITTPVWLIVPTLFLFGFLQSLQYTSMNTLAYSDVDEEQASSASTLASTMQQMSLSFAVAAASLATELFVPAGRSASANQMIHGIHLAFLVLGGWTILSTLTFTALEERDGEAVSRHGVTRS